MAYLRRFGGPYILEISGGKIREYGGPWELVYENGSIKHWGGPIIAQFDGRYFKPFGGAWEYEVVGFVTHDELLALITLLYL